MSIRLKVIGLTVISSFVLLIAMMINIFYQEKVVSSQVDHELETLMLNHTKNVVQNVSSQLTGLHEVLVAEVSNGLKVARSEMQKKGKVELNPNETVAWNAINQYDKKVKKIRIPKMTVGGEWLGKNRLMTVASPVVDQTKRLQGGTATIFQRINEQGDMLRVCTNVEKLDKTRAIGTYIPAINPNGSENNVISTLMSGDTYNGRAFVVNAWYLTSYEPIYDSNRKIIGALYFGIKQEKTEVLRKGIENTVLGKSGYLYVLDRKGNYIISKEGLKDGENIWNNKDEDGNYYIQSIIRKALILKPGEVIYQKYKLNDNKENIARTRVSSITYFEPWDWIVGAGAYEDDFKETKFKVQHSINKMVMWGAGIGLILTAFILLIAVIVADKITRPITQLTEAADDISQGNLDRKINIRSKDETGQLAEAFERMQSSLRIVANRAKRKRDVLN